MKMGHGLGCREVGDVVNVEIEHNVNMVNTIILPRDRLSRGKDDLKKQVNSRDKVL